MSIVQHAIHAARHRTAWGKYAARVYTQRHGVPSGRLQDGLSDGGGGMSINHHGPHCAGSCEGQAYSLRIKNLESENQRLRAALTDMVTSYEVLGAPLPLAREVEIAMDALEFLDTYSETKEPSHD